MIHPWIATARVRLCGTLACVLSVFAATVPAVGYAQQPVVLDKVVAVVGDKPILYSEIEEYIAYATAQGEKLPLGARCQVLDQLISQKILVYQAEIDSFLVADTEVEAQLQQRIDQILGYMNNNVDQFVAYYGKSPVEMKEEMRESLREQLMAQNMQRNIIKNIKVTPSEVKAFFNAIPRDSIPYFNSEVSYSVIMLKPKVSADAERAAREKAAELRRRVMEEGANFEELAKKHSQDPGSARQGGNLGMAPRGTYVPEFEAAAFKLQPKQLSTPVKTQFGYHIIRLNERRGNLIDVSHILVKPELTSADMEAAARRLDTIRTLIVTDSLTFSKAVALYSEDEQSKNNGGQAINPRSGEAQFEVPDLETYVYFTLDTMKIGRISRPIAHTDVSGETQYLLLRLDSRTKPHRANLTDDYDKIQAATMERKKSVYVAQWLQKQAAKTYIAIDPAIGDCPNLRRWQAKELSRSSTGPPK